MFNSNLEIFFCFFGWDWYNWQPSGILKTVLSLSSSYYNYLRIDCYIEDNYIIKLVLQENKENRQGLFIQKMHWVSARYLPQTVLVITWLRHNPCPEIWHIN